MRSCRETATKLQYGHHPRWCVYPASPLVTLKHERQDRHPSGRLVRLCVRRMVVAASACWMMRAQTKPADQRSRSPMKRWGRGEELRVCALGRGGEKYHWEIGWMWVGLSSSWEKQDGAGWGRERRRDFVQFLLARSGLHEASMGVHHSVSLSIQTNGIQDELEQLRPSRRGWRHRARPTAPEQPCFSPITPRSVGLTGMLGLDLLSVVCQCVLFEVQRSG